MDSDHIQRQAMILAVCIALLVIVGLVAVVA
jgi:hypothetical protein